MNAFVKIKGNAPFGQSPEGASLFCAAGNQRGEQGVLSCRRLAVIFLAASNAASFENQYYREFDENL